MNHIDPYPISALLDRYELKSKQAVYDRINALGIQPVNRGKISSQQLDELDKLHEHIKAGGAIDDFVNGGRAVVHTPTAGIPDGSATFIQLVHEIAVALRPTTNPIEHWFSLERAAASNLLLSSTEIKQLIGVKPAGSSFTRGSFTFIKSGKIGNATAWKIEKL